MPLTKIISFGNGCYTTIIKQTKSLDSINNQQQDGNIQSQTKRRDIYAQMPLRALGYTNEFGEAIRPLSPMLANLSWLPAIGYISADIADKYRQDEYSVKTPSKKRASEQLIIQLLASVFLPTLAVKAGQSLTNKISALGKTKLSINTRERISDMVLESMKHGEHKKFVLGNGKIDKETYKSFLSDQIKEALKHKNTHNRLNPMSAVSDIHEKPFITSSYLDNIEKYSGEVIDRLIDERQNLLDGIKPQKMSDKKFRKFTADTKNILQPEKQSVAFDYIRKTEKSRMFNNRILKSAGGLLALAIMAKPIDEFVKNIAMKKYMSPMIESLSKSEKN